MNNLFEMATRSKLRFPFKGQVSVEDLWDLPVQSLDTVFKALNSKAKQVKEESLLSTRTKEDKILDAQIEIVKYIVKVKLEEESAKLESKARSDKRQKILSVLSTKQDQELQNKSPEELKEMLRGLEGE